MQVNITGMVVLIDKNMAEGYVIIDESDDSDVDESLQYSVKMTPAIVPYYTASND